MKGSRKGAEVTVKPNMMKNSILDRLKNPKADPLKRPKVYMGAATEGRSRSEPFKGEMKPRREKRPKRKHGQMW